MKDLNLAKQILKEEDQSLVVVKNGEVIYRSVDRGIKPMLTLTNTLKEEATASPSGRAGLPSYFSRGDE